MSSLFAALQLADSFFPTGMYTQSHGLEAFVAAGRARDAGDVAALLHSYLRGVVGPGDALAARWVVRAGADLELVRNIDRRLEATKPSAEGRLASRRCGGRIVALAQSLGADARLAGYAALLRAGEAPGHQAVALALAGAAAGLDEETVTAVEIHGFAVSLLGAAARLGTIDHREAQLALRQAQPLMDEVAAQGRGMHWSEIGGFAPQIDLMQLRHAGADARLFVS
jgi:urease accessory protein